MESAGAIQEIRRACQPQGVREGARMYPEQGAHHRGGTLRSSGRHRVPTTWG